MIIQEVRGRFVSEGGYYPFLDDGTRINRNGYDTVEDWPTTRDPMVESGPSGAHTPAQPSISTAYAARLTCRRTMTSYLTNLDLRTRVKEFDEDELRDLIALSHKDFPWRSTEGLRGEVELSENDLVIPLKNLVERSLVRTTAGKNLTQALFNLAERLDPEIEVNTAFRKWNS